VPWISHAEEEGRLEELRGSARAGKVASGKIVLALRGAECRHVTTLRGKDAFGVLVQAAEEDFWLQGVKFLFSQVSSLEGVCWNIRSRVASSTLGRNGSGMKGQHTGRRKEIFTVGSARKTYI